MTGPWAVMVAQTLAMGNDPMVFTLLQRVIPLSNTQCLTLHFAMLLPCFIIPLCLLTPEPEENSHPSQQVTAHRRLIYLPRPVTRSAAVR